MMGPKGNPTSRGGIDFLSYSADAYLRNYLFRSRLFVSLASQSFNFCARLKL